MMNVCFPIFHCRSFSLCGECGYDVWMHHEHNSVLFSVEFCIVMLCSFADNSLYSSYILCKSMNDYRMLTFIAGSSSASSYSVQLSEHKGYNLTCLYRCFLFFGDLSKNPTDFEGLVSEISNISHCKCTTIQMFHIHSSIQSWMVAKHFTDANPLTLGKSVIPST